MVNLLCIKPKRNDATNAFYEPERRFGPFRALINNRMITHITIVYTVQL